MVQPADRGYWDARSSASTMKAVDALSEIAKLQDSSIEIKYNKAYIGLQRNGVAFNFLTFRPTKRFVNLELKLLRSDDVDALVEASGVELDYNVRWTSYRLQLAPNDVRLKDAELKKLVELAYQRRAGS